MTTHRSKGAQALLAALLVASCSQSPTTPTPTKSAAVKGSDGNGVVSGSAVGDVKNGPIEMTLVRVGQAIGGVPAFYANANGTYTIRPNVDTEIYIQIWSSDPVVQNPRLIVDWGNGERDNIGCGGCRLSKTYRTEGKYTVKVIMDDRISGQTSRTFVFDVRSGVPDPGFGVFSVTLTGGDPPFNPTGCGFGTNGNHPYKTFTIHHPGGHLHLETTSAGCYDTMLGLYPGSFNPSSPCSFAAFDDDNGNPSCGFWTTIDGTFSAGDYVVVATNFNHSNLGTFSLDIHQ